MAKGDWKPPVKKPKPERGAKMVRAAAILKGDEIRLSTKGKVGRVTSVEEDDEGRRVFAMDVLGERRFHPDHLLLRLDPKPPTLADFRRNRR